MRRRELEPHVWAILAGLCLWALAWRPTEADRPFQTGVLCLALAGTAFGWAVTRRAPHLPWPAWALVGWIGWQVVPLPLDWLRALSPDRAEAVAAALAVGASPWTSIAADPAAAVRGGVILAGLFAVFALSRAAGTSAGRAVELLALGLTAAAAVQAAIGLEQYLSALYSGSPEPLARGTFVNRGQFAAFLLAGIGAGVGWALEHVSAWRQRPEWAVAAGAIALLLFGGLLASMSRAALAAAFLVAIAAAVLSGRRFRVAGLAGLLAITAGLALTTAGERLTQRFETLAGDQGDQGRLAVWRDAAPLARERGLAGVGPGGFGVTFERTSAYFPRKNVSHAHSDWLEAWIELGAIGFVVLVGAVLLAGKRAVGGSALALGCLAGASGPLLQGLVDLPLQSPAVAAAVACCLGLAAGECSPQPDGCGSIRRLAASAVAVAVLVAGLLAPRTAEAVFERAERAWAQGDIGGARALLLETLGRQPRAAAVWLRLSEVARSEGDLEQALRLARQAQRWEPFTLRTEWVLADLELVHGDPEVAVHRLATMVQAAPDMRPAAIQALARGGAARSAIEAALGTSDGQAAGDYLVFLARNGDPELEPAYERLVVERGLEPPPAEAAYIAKRLDQKPIGRIRK